MPLVLAATPIGDPRDASPRLREELAGADVVAAEDTRRLRALAAKLDVRTRAKHGADEQKARVQHAVANVRREVIQDAGHMLHHDQPQALAALVEAFLS